MAKWSLSIDKYARATKGDMNRAARAAILDIYARILIRSPVDTGRFRGAWTIGLNAVIAGDNGVFGLGRFEGGEPGANGMAAYSIAIRQGDKVAMFKLGDRVVINNSLPYAVRLEMGYSDQAPPPLGIVRRVAMESGAIVKSRFRRGGTRGVQ